MGRIYMTPSKIKSLNQLARSYDHNMRYRFCENTDSERRDGNRQVMSRPHSYTDHYKQRIKECGRYSGRNAAPIRRDAVRAVDICIAVSSTEQETNPFFDLDQFCELGKKWVCETFGEQNVAGITLHMDEKAPHLHAIVIPVTEDNRLSCFDFIGTPQKLSHMQDTIAEAMKSLHLERGLKKSVAEHKTMKEYYGAIEAAMTDSLPEPINGETARQYAIRANIEFNKEKAKHLQETLDMRREIDVARTEARTAGGDNEALLAGIAEREAQLAKRKEELDALERKIGRSGDALKQWGDIVHAVKSHLLPRDTERQLMANMQEALAATQKEREANEAIDDKEINKGDEDS